MESCNRKVPRIIPDAILTVLCVLEEDNDRFLWKLSRNQDGLSLVIKTHPVREHRGRCRQQKGNVVHSTSVKARTSLEKDSTANSRSVNVPHKHKSPSALARNNARKLEYRRRKAASRKARKNAPAVTPLENSQSETSVATTSDVHTLECSIPAQTDHCQSESNVITTRNIEQTLECSDVSNTDNSQSETSVVADVQTLETDNPPLIDTEKELDAKSDTSNESDIESELLTSRTFCNECNKPAADCPNGLKACTQCKICHYCSRQCQATHWKAGHRGDCAKLARLAAIYAGSQS